MIDRQLWMDERTDKRQTCGWIAKYIKIQRQAEW